MTKAPLIRLKLFARSVCAWAGMAIVALSLAPFITLLTPFSRTASLRLTQLCAWVMLRVVGADLEVQNESGFDRPPRGAVYISNHQSYLDVLALLAAVEGGFKFLAKRSLLLMPGVNIVLLGHGHFLVGRKKVWKTLGKLKRRAPKMLAAGDRIFIFPEGGRGRDGKVGDFRDGAAAVAIWAKAPLVPVAIIGTREILPRENWPVKAGKIVLIIGKPFHTGDLTVKDRKLLTSRARKWIIGKLQET